MPDTVPVPIEVLDKIKDALNDGLDAAADVLAHGYGDPTGKLEVGSYAMSCALEEVEKLTWPRPIPGKALPYEVGAWRKRDA